VAGRPAGRVLVITHGTMLLFLVYIASSAMRRDGLLAVTGCRRLPSVRVV